MGFIYTAIIDGRSFPALPPPTQLPADQLPRVGDRVWLLSGTALETTVQELKVTRIAGVLTRYYVLTRADGGITTALPEDFYSAGQPDLPQGFYVVDPRREVSEGTPSGPVPPHVVEVTEPDDI